MKQVVQFGAGNIGRGFLGQLYSQSGWRTIFVDIQPPVLEALQKREGYAIHIMGPGAEVVPVRNVTALDGRQVDAVAAAIDEADLVGTAVGVGALAHIVPALARGLERRARRNAGIDVVICENLLDAGEFLRNKVLEAIRPGDADFVRDKVGFVETVVSRMIPPPTPEQIAADPLYIGVEAYGVLPCSEQGFRNGVPAIEGLRPTPKIHAYEERKLFAHNCTHALASYFGYLAGHEFIWQSMGDPAVRSKVEAGGWESGRALCQKHGFTTEEHREHLEDLFERFSNRALGDTVVRCGRDPVRKLGPRDRLVGAALLALEYGQTPSVLAEGIAAALRFQPPGDPSAPRIGELIREGGAQRVLREICDLPATAPLAKMVIDAYGTPS